jgi:nickel/cobalt transporter (NicO) family protein
MQQLIVGTLTLSILHALIPSHWLPLVAIGRRENWTLSKVLRTTMLAAVGHILSTLLIGVMIGVLGWQLASWVNQFTHIIAPSIIIILGAFFIYRHHKHKHFHLDEPTGKITDKQIVLTLFATMFLSPCLEIEAYFLMAGIHGSQAVILIGLIYTVITIAGMLIWVGVMYRGVINFNWHLLDHNAGMITGATLILTGLISFFIQ